MNSGPNVILFPNRKNEGEDFKIGRCGIAQPLSQEELKVLGEARANQIVAEAEETRVSFRAVPASNQERRDWESIKRGDFALFRTYSEKHPKSSAHDVYWAIGRVFDVAESAKLGEIAFPHNSGYPLFTFIREIKAPLAVLAQSLNREIGLGRGDFKSYYLTVLSGGRAAMMVGALRDRGLIERE